MTAKVFKDLPPFPEDVLTAEIPILSLDLLEIDNESESERLYGASRFHGCFQIDLQSSKMGRDLLQNVDSLFDVGEDAFKMSLEEKMDYKMPLGNMFG